LQALKAAAGKVSKQLGGRDPVESRELPLG
jgi:hypothetical protein